MKNSRKCLKCGENLHVVDFRHQTEDYLGLFQVCLDCEPEIVEKLKKAILDYCKGHIQSPEKSEKRRTIISGELGRPIDIDETFSGLAKNHTIAVHLLYLMETCIQITESLLARPGFPRKLIEVLKRIRSHFVADHKALVLHMERKQLERKGNGSETRIDKPRNS